MRYCIASIALVAATACGGGDGRPNVGTTQDSVCSDVAEVACFDMFQCCSEGEIEQALGVDEPRTQADCVNDVEAICNRQIATLTFSAENKRVRFDSKLMDECLKAFIAPENTCADVAAAKPWTEVCMESAWVGTVENGGACDFAHECAANAFCSPNRICTALPVENQACNTTRGCATGLFCDAGTCHARRAAGAACTLNDQCQTGLFCDTLATLPTCTARRANGEVCTSNASCTSLTCLPGTCAGSATTCTTNTGCSAHCADDNSFCTTDASCALGTCSGTTTSCSSDLGCITPAVCVFPVKCLAAECVGPVVCGDPHVVVDYCRGPLTDLPGFEPQG
jgi:hypothetical protein